MKRVHWFVLMLCLVLSPVFQSCDDDEGYSIGQFTVPLWATVRVENGSFYFDSDLWGTLLPFNTGSYVPVDGQRVLASFSPLYDDYQGYDHAVQIYQLWNVLTKQVDTLTAETDEEFGNDPVTIYQGDITISGGYMNIIFLQNLPAKEKHRISLVRPEDDAELYGEDGYVHLELRYNDYDDVTGYGAWGLVSYNLSSLNITDETKGIKLKLNSSVNGEVEVAFDFASSNEEYSESQLKEKDMDFSKMQLK